MSSTSAPAAPAARLFRGWYVVAALFVTGFALYGAGLYSFILFVVPLSKEFHWSHAATGSLVSAFWLSAPLALFTDPLIRRFGIARLALTGIVLEAGCLMLLFTATTLWQMYLLRALAGLGKVLYAINLPIILSRWFSRRFGLALASMYCGWHLGGLVLAPLTQHLIAALGWRGASAVLGIGLLAIALPPTIWVLRVPSAEAVGLGLDGDPPGRRVRDPASPAADAEPAPGRFRSVLRLRALQLIVAASLVYYLTYSGVLAHQAAVLEAAGASPRAASLVVGSTAGFAALGALLLGWVLDSFSILRATVLQYGLMAIGVVCLLQTVHVASPGLLVAHALAFGLAVGGTDVYWITTLKRRTPESLFSVAWSAWYFIELATIVIAPALAGHLYDVTGSYAGALTTELLILVLPFALCLVVARAPGEPAVAVARD